MAKVRFGFMVEEETLRDFEKLAAASHMDATTYASVWISRAAELKLDNGLAAITAIPKEMFRQRPGRPSADAKEVVALEK